MIEPRRIRRGVRIGVYTVLAAMLGYTAWRYDLASLPSEGCSPLLLYEPGDSLVLDRHPGTPAAGRVVLYRSPAGELLLGRIEAPPPSASAEVWSAHERGALWIVGDRASCPGEDSRVFGPVDPGAVEAVVAFSLPW